ncbi:MAG: M48 family metalloprotease [Thermoplasmatota archaeon]
MASISTLKINSYFFMGILFLIFAMFAFIIGVLIGVDYIVMTVIFLLITVFYVAISPLIMKLSSRVRYLEKGEIPYLEEKVSKLAKEADIPMPRLGIVEDPTPNAFVFGLSQRGSTLAVHRGILEMLNDGEMEAVLAHEIGHIKNRDCMYMTILSVLPAIAMWGMQLLFMARFAPRGRDAGKAVAVMLLIGLVSAIVYYLSTLLIKRLSRIREFYADAFSGFLTKDPHSLASALTKITYGLSLAPPEEKSKARMRQFYIGDVQNAHSEMDRIYRNSSKYDLDGDGIIDENELELAMADEANRSAWERWGGLMRTHPPTFKRILALKEMEKEMDKGVVESDNIYEKVEF